MLSATSALVGAVAKLRHHAGVAGTRWYLEMTAREQLRPPTQRADSRPELRVCSDPVLFRGIHRRVATPHGWSSLQWSEDRWAEEFARPNVGRWSGQVRDEVVGMASADIPPSANFEITSFGLVAEHVGKGIGGLFLSVVVEVMWTAGAERIWLHTQDSDHEHALSDYLARLQSVSDRVTPTRPSAR